MRPSRRREVARTRIERRRHRTGCCLFVHSRPGVFTRAPLSPLSPFPGLNLHMQGVSDPCARVNVAQGEDRTYPPKAAYPSGIYVEPLSVVHLNAPAAAFPQSHDQGSRAGATVAKEERCCSLLAECYATVDVLLSATTDDDAFTGFHTDELALRELFNFVEIGLLLHSSHVIETYICL